MARILIRYRSGHVQGVEVASLKVRYSTVAGEMRVEKMEWEDMVPYPLFLNLEAVESVWELPEATEGEP